MDELIETLQKNGYSRDKNMTLSNVIANTMQDGQYSSGAYEDTTYQVELEIIDPSKVNTRDELYILLHKIFDLLKLF